MEFVEKHQFIDGLVERESTLPCVYCGNEKWALLIDEPIDLSNQQLLNFALVAPIRKAASAGPP